jgi:hypothetical protein
MPSPTPRRVFQFDLPDHFEDGGHDSELKVTVVFTTREATLKALRAADLLAQGLNARLEMIVTEIVPFRLPLERPGVSPEFLRERRSALVAEAGLEVDEVRVEICLCRDPKDVLRRVLAPRSLVLVGGRKRWWKGKEQRLEQFLNGLGHRVVFVSIGAKDCSQALAKYANDRKLAAQAVRR